MDKADGAFLTIGELADQLGVAQHILRYWETRFPQLKPLQRSGNRRYYRPADVETARRINRLLNEQGYTVRGAQRVLEGKATEEPQPVVTAPVTPPTQPGSVSGGRATQSELALGGGSSARRASEMDSSDLALLIARLTVIRENLKEAIDAD